MSTYESMAEDAFRRLQEETSYPDSQIRKLVSRLYPVADWKAVDKALAGDGATRPSAVPRDAHLRSEHADKMRSRGVDPTTGDSVRK